MWKLITVITVKLLIAALRLFGRHATALPGLVAQRMHPHLLGKMVKAIPGGSIVVTGTNGKTTTAKILRKILEGRDLRVLANASGSNFTRGILASLIDHAGWTGRLKYDIAVLEVDEAYTPMISAEIKPLTITVLNVMRDQLDRYGEIDNTVALIASALKHSDGLVVNQDDLPLEVLRENVKRTTTFGVASSMTKLLPSDDELHAEQASYRKPRTKAEVELISFRRGDRKTVLKVAVGKQDHAFMTRLEGVHNYLNITAALATVHHSFGGIEPKDLETIGNIKPAFGRGERLDIEGTPVHLALVKNPAGFNQNVRSFMNEQVGAVLFIINDRYADGRDVSWLWDIDLGPIAKQTKTRLMASGVRAYDMALRLQNQELDTLLVEPRINKALRQALHAVPKDKELLILPTYTAMLEVRKLLLKKQKQGERWR